MSAPEDETIRMGRGEMAGGPHQQPESPDARAAQAPGTPTVEPKGHAAGTRQGPPPGVPAGPPPGIDFVSGALNVAAFGREFSSCVQSHPTGDLAVWFIDVRNFRSINPKYGYETGNAVLKAMASATRSCLSGELPVARLGGDRFVVLSQGLTDDAVQQAFSKLTDRLRTEVALLGVTHPLVLAAGVYFLRAQDYEDPVFQRCLDYASIAHRSAHDSSSDSVAIFTDEDLARDMRRMAIEQSIDAALADGQIEVWYQPQVDYAYGEIIGAEALARWHHPELGWVPPSEFIPVLENCGKVHALDLFVWEEACRNASRWRSVADGKPVPISVNVSRTEMYEPGLMEHFLELQSKYDLPDGSLRLEVTESAFVEEADRLYSVIERMREHNMMVEMDDFGSGLSSLSMLKDVPVDVVKLDMGFLRSAMGEERGGVVLGSVIRMLQGLDTPIIAEGVETLEQAEMLKNMGCHLMQGYHFSRAMPRDEFEAFVASNRAVEQTSRRERADAHLEELLAIDPSSSYLFNHAVGGMAVFIASEGSSELILTNDQIYAECGIDRDDLGEQKVDPLGMLDEMSRVSLLRAAAEAREHGSAYCRAKVALSGVWLDCVIRHLGESVRGDVYSAMVSRSVRTDGDNELSRKQQDAAWYVEAVRAIANVGILRCAMDDGLTVSYLSPQLLGQSGLTNEDFARLFHNSLYEAVVAPDRPQLKEAIAAGARSHEPFACLLRLRHGFGAGQRSACLIGRVIEVDSGTTSLHAQIAILGDGEGESADAGAAPRGAAFEYDMISDRLTLKPFGTAGEEAPIVFEGWLKRIDALPDTISGVSAAKILATARDLRHHPSSGFVDIKANIHGGAELTWYHVDYACESNERGETVLVQGFARDADDQVASARWWRQQAETDQLTGLLNRNAVEQEINVAMRVQGAGMMFMVDLDGFKGINDRLGHLMGDALLRDVGEALEGAFREGDLVGRYGGDEFVAFMPLMGGDPAELAERRARQIISAISAITARDGTHAACSVGVAISHNPEATFYDLLEVADQAMYASKEAGKGVFTVRTMD